METNHHTVCNERLMQDSFDILSDMRRDRKLCDVTLVAKGVEIPAHKTVLASCSPYFYCMFTNHAYAREERIELDVEPRALLSIVTYMYTSKLRVQHDNINDLLEISKMLLLNAIQEECSKVIDRFLCPNNCFIIKATAAKNGDSELLCRVSHYINTNFVEIADSPQFLSLTFNELSEMLSSDELVLPSEEKIYESVVSWIGHDSKGRRKYLRSLMGYVRLPFISKRYLKEHIVNSPFLRGDATCKDMIIKALLEDDTTTPSKMAGRLYHGTNGVLLVIGGCEVFAERSLEYYDLEKQKWSAVFKMPFDSCYASLAAVNSKAYIVGGFTDGKRVSSVRYYDVTTNIWLDTISITVEREAHSTVVLDNCIYAIGGTSDGRTALNCGEKFNITLRKWYPIAPMFIKRWGLGTAVLNGILYAVGGGDGDTDLKSVECYNPHTDSWKLLGEMNARRSGLGVCALDGKIYAIGGSIGKEYLSTVEVYDPDTDRWTRTAPMNVDRAWASAAVLHDRIFVTGGKNRLSKNLCSMEVYEKSSDTWTLLPDVMNVERSGHAMVALNVRLRP